MVRLTIYRLRAQVLRVPKLADLVTESITDRLLTVVASRGDSITYAVADSQLIVGRGWWRHSPYVLTARIDTLRDAMTVQFRVQLLPSAIVAFLGPALMFIAWPIWFVVAWTTQPSVRTSSSSPVLWVFAVAAIMIVSVLACRVRKVAQSELRALFQPWKKITGV